MSAVIALCAAPDTVGQAVGQSGGQAAALAAALAQRLTGPVVVIPYDTLRRDWPHKADPTDVATVTHQQVKLLCAGYVRAGYHVVLHGAGLNDPDGALDTLLRLMATIPGVHPHRADLATRAVSADLGAMADALLDQLPPEARDAR